MKFLKAIFSIKNENNHKVVKLLGLKIKFKRKNYFKSENKITVTKTANIGWWKNGWLEFITPGEQFAKSYSQLIKNTDVESINTVNNIINDMRFYKKNRKSPLFSESDANDVVRIESIHNSKILQLDDDKFAYEQFLLPINYFEIGIFYEKYNMSEFENLAAIRKGCIIDAGAFIGDSSVILAQYTDNKVYAFEPVNANYNLLLKTISINTDLQEHIVPVNLALSDITTNIDISVNGQCSSVVNKVSEASETINTITLDEFVEKNSLQVSLIKTDVEGFEQNLLRGAQKTIAKQKPALLVSMYHGYNDFFNIKPLIESWNLGYKFKIRKPKTRSISNGTLLLAEIVY